MTVSRRVVALVILLVFVLQPVLAAAQTVKAGVVTTVEGNVTARRVVLPAPVALKFKDDVFLQDNITTGDNSFARFLLGGKAVVTVRERSRMTITEIPGRSEVNLESGKIGMAVARDRMRPGEVINIKTPNAIVAVRGTVLVVEVGQATAQAGGPAGGSVTTDVYLLKDNVDVTHVNPATGNPIGAPHALMTLQRFRAVGSAPPQITVIRPDQIGQINAGLAPRGVGRGNGGSQESAKAVVMDTTTSVLAAITGTGGERLLVEYTPPGPLLTPTEKPTTTLLLPEIPPSSTPEEEQEVQPPPPPVVLADVFRVVPGETLSPASPLIDGDNLHVGPAANVLHVLGGAPGGPAPGTVIATDTLLAFRNGSVVDIANNLVRLGDGGILDASGAVTPLVVFENSSYFGGVGLNTFTGGSLLRMFSSTGRAGSQLTVNGTYVHAAASTIVSRETPLFNIADGATITGLSSRPFARFENVLATVPSSFFNFATHTSFPGFTGSGDRVTVELAGPLFKGIESLIFSGDTFLRLNNDVRFEQTGSRPTVKLEGIEAGTLVEVAANFFAMTAGAGRPAPTMQIEGSLLKAHLTALFTGDPEHNTRTFAFIGDGAQLHATGSQPLFDLHQVFLDTAGNVLTLRRSRPDQASRLELNGPLLYAQDALFDTTSLGFAEQFGASPTLCCPGFFIAQGARLRGHSGDALIQLIDVFFNSGGMGDAQTGSSFFSMSDAQTGTTEIVAPAAVEIDGALLYAFDTEIRSLSSTVSIGRSSFISHGTDPLIEAVDTIIRAGDVNPLVPGQTVTGRLVNLFSASSPGQAASPASMTLAGPLARFSNTDVHLTSDVLGVFNGATFTSLTPEMEEMVPQTVIQFLAGSSLSAGGVLDGRILSVSGTGGLTGADLATATIDAGLFHADSSSISTASGLVRVGPGGRLVSRGTGDAIARFTGGTHTLGTIGGRSMFELSGVTSNTTTETDGTVTTTYGTDRAIQGAAGSALARSLLRADSATIDTPRAARFDHVLFETTKSIFDLNNSSLNVTGVGGTLKGVDLAMAKVVKTGSGALVALNASHLQVANASVIGMASSILNVATDLFSLANGSSLRALNGALLNVTSNSIVNITGGLAAFVGTGNLIQVAGGACGSACQVVNGIPVLVQPGGQLTINGTPIKNPGGGTVNWVGGNSPAIVVDGTSKVTIHGQ